MKYWIKDTDNSPNGYPLSKLCTLVLEELSTDEIEISIYRSEGYGETINALNLKLDSNVKVQIDRSLLITLTKTDKEWFYNFDVQIRTNTKKINFGLHDSSSLYIEGKNSDVEIIIQHFNDVIPSKK